MTDPGTSYGHPHAQADPASYPPAPYAPLEAGPPPGTSTGLEGSPEDTRPTTSEVAESLTGYEEIAIEKAFGADATELGGNKPARALAFVLAKREGLPHAEAFDRIMEMPIKAVVDLFADDTETDTEDPETPAGKDASPPESVPTS